MVVIRRPSRLALSFTIMVMFGAAMISAVIMVLTGTYSPQLPASSVPAETPGPATRAVK